MALVHCSYHKCLTKYYRLIFSSFYSELGLKDRYTHFNSGLAQFYQYSHLYHLKSVNNHFVDIDTSAPDTRISRFIRDPRDLVVSGYFYHKNGREKWTRIENPREKDWSIVNGVLPDAMVPGESFTDFLDRLPLEEGLIAEIQFRRAHFESMRSWPELHSRIKLFRYEDIVGNEREIFSQLGEFYGFDQQGQDKLGTIAERLSAKNMKNKDQHIRNHQPGQWQDILPESVKSYFNSRYGDILERYGYA